MVMPSTDTSSSVSSENKPERECQTALKTFATQNIKFVDEVKAFLELEKAKISKMWQLSVKIKLLSSKSPPMYPEEVTEAVQREVVSELNAILNGHGTKLVDCESELQILQKDHRKFKQSCFCLDWNEKSGFIDGNEYQKPLKYFMNVGDDVISQAKLILLNLRAAFDVLKLNESQTFEDYNKSFVIADDFLDLMNEFLVFCNIYLKYCG